MGAILEHAVPSNDSEGITAELLVEDAHWRLSQLNHGVFNRDRIYRHRLLRINYTTYDLQ